MLDEDTVLELSRRDMISYREFAFPASIAQPDHNPFFSLENPSSWITVMGWELFKRQESMETEVDVDEIRHSQLLEFREMIVAPQYLEHKFFSLDNTQEWVRLGAFANYAIYKAPGPSRSFRSHSSPTSSRAASVHWSRPASRSQSRASGFSYSAASSPPRTRTGSIASSRYASSRRSPSAHISPDPLLSTMATPDVPEPAVPASGDEPRPDRPRGRTLHKGKGKAKAHRSGTRIHISREHSVGQIIPLTSAPSTWTVNDDAAYRLDLSVSTRLFTAKPGAKHPMSIQRLIKREASLDQDSWKASGGGHKGGDTTVYGFSEDLSIGVRAKRIHHHCNGVHICELVPEELFADCERYEPDPDAMLELWHHVLDANEKEANSVGSILLRFYTQLSNTKCPKKECVGVARLAMLPNAPNHLGKIYYVGCSDAGSDPSLEHIYIPIPVNLNEEHLKFVMENDGRLPDGISVAQSDTCVLSLHPANTMEFCRYGHSKDGKIKAAKIIERPCDAELIIFVPSDDKDGKQPPKWTSHLAIVIARNFHNHPTHPTRKPSLEEEQRIRSLISSISVEGLTTQRLRNHPLTNTEFGGERLARAAPGLANSRRLKDLIKSEMEVKYPAGMDWDGVMYQLTKVQPTLDPSRHFIRAAINKRGFFIVVTLHFGVGEYIHSCKALCIDFSFKRVAGAFNEWKVAIFIHRYNMRITAATLYCDRNTRPAFKQLFIELFDTVQRVTGRELGLRPWRPEANCRVILLDGEVAQAQGFGDFLVGYNDPSISGIHSRDPLELVEYSLKSCQVHFKRNITETLAKSAKLSSADIKTLISWPSLKTPEERESYHHFCANHSEPGVHSWHAQKLSNPWYLVSMNPYLSKINCDDYALTPNSTNLVESAHAHLNSQTQIGLPLLAAILTDQDAQDRKYDELDQVENEAIIANHRGGLAERERSATQRMVSKMKKTNTRNAGIADYNSLQQEREEGIHEWKVLLLHEKELQARIKTLKNSRRTDAKEAMKGLRAQVKAGVDARRVWRARQGVIDLQLAELRRGELHGVRIQGHRPVTTDPESAETEQVEAVHPPVDYTDPESAEMEQVEAVPPPVKYTQFFDHLDIGPGLADLLDQPPIEPIDLNLLFALDTPVEFGLDLRSNVPYSEPTYHFNSASDYQVEMHTVVLDPMLDPDYIGGLQGTLPQPDTAMEIEPVATNVSGKRARSTENDLDAEAGTRRLTRKRQPTARSLGLSYEDRVLHSK
ncbi:hypothetical protein GGX14DRAFT_580166 [Mycena pura]|uniref:Uncharacterized protein n=1 Tax=Mycena pura TaxID=153505 RepID=A0AAD6XZM3_9AGAR|nr:hypothetical protein GGX14DRAFT_580166 [Mycena pura]